MNLWRAFLQINITFQNVIPFPVLDITEYITASNKKVYENSFPLRNKSVKYKKVHAFIKMEILEITNNKVHSIFLIIVHLKCFYYSKRLDTKYYIIKKRSFY